MGFERSLDAIEEEYKGDNSVLLEKYVELKLQISELESKLEKKEKEKIRNSELKKNLSY